MVFKQAVPLIRSEPCKYLREEHSVKGLASVKTNVVCLRNPEGCCDLWDCNGQDGT